MLNFDDFRCKILPTTLADIKRSVSTKNEAITGVMPYLISCGFYTTVWTDSMREMALAEGISVATEIPTGVLVTYLEDVARFLTEEQVYAILRHEEGHVVAGHLDGAFDAVSSLSVDALRAGYQKVMKDADPRTLARSVSVDEQHEFEADDHALRYVAPDVLVSALRQVVHGTAMVVTRGVGSPKMEEELLSHPVIQARLARLEAMCA
jgi:hypothetical protein